MADTCYSCGRPKRDEPPTSATALVVLDRARSDVANYLRFLRVGLFVMAAGMGSAVTATVMGASGDLIAFGWVVASGAVVFLSVWFAVNVGVKDAWNVRGALRTAERDYAAVMARETRQG